MRPSLQSAPWRRLVPWVLAFGTLAACAHTGTARRTNGAEAEALLAALAHPTQRDRPLLERRLDQLDAHLARQGRETTLTTRVHRIEVLNALAGLSAERVRALEEAATQPDADSVVAEALAEATERARAQRRDLFVRVDAALSEVLTGHPDAEEAPLWLGQRLRLAIELGRRDAVEIAVMLLRRFPSAPDVRLAHVVLGKAAIEAQSWDEALMHFSRASAPETGGEDDAIAVVSRAELPRAYVRSREPATLTGVESAEYLESLHFSSEAILEALDGMVTVALEDGRTLEALDVATTARERAAEGSRACRARARVLSIRLLREGARNAAEELTPALESYIALRATDRGSARELGCRTELVGPSLSIATQLYQDALGLPATAGLGDRVPPAVRPFDRDRMRRVDALLELIAGAFPDLRAEETRDASHPQRDAVQIDAARRVVTDAIIATDPTPPPSPRRHPPRRRSPPRRRPHHR